jgi:orotate phosphoribosyltransferase
MRLFTRSAGQAQTTASTNGGAVPIGKGSEEILLAALKKIALVKQEVVLSSGERAQYYVDVKSVLLLPGPFRAVGELVAERATQLGAQVVGGLTMGADPIACAAIGASSQLKGFFVRKDPKGHGLQRWIEGPEIQPGERALVVDDVVTTGGSLIDAIRRLRKERIEIAGALSIVDRQAGGEDAIKEALGDPSLPYVSLFTIDDVYPDRPDR